MKKTLLSIIALGCAMLASAATPGLMWHKLVDGPNNAADNMCGITVTTDGNIVTVGSFGAKTVSDEFVFDGQTIATGTDHNGASENHNLLVTKHNAKDGSLVWALSTKKGDVTSSGSNAVAATADGGVVLLVNMRSSQVVPYESPVIVDAAKTEIDFPDWNTSCWIMNQVVIKVSKEGYVQWVRRIVADQLPVPAATSGASVTNTTNGAFPYTIAEDKDGNIYVAGNHRVPLVFTGDKNSAYVLQPRNLDSYNGDTQNHAGGLYLVKLDKEGNYLTHLQGLTADGVTADYISSMVVEDDMVYFAGYFYGKAGSSLRLGKGSAVKEVTKLNDNNAVLLGAVKSTVDGEIHSLAPQFLTCYNEATATSGTAKSHRIQFLNLSKTGSSLFIMGTFQGGVSTNESENAFISSQTGSLEGFIVKAAASDGAYQASMANKISIGGYRNIVSYNGSLYAQGYRLNSQTGSFIHELDPETLEIKATTTIAKGGNAPTLVACAYDAESTRIYSATRGSNTFTLTDETVTGKPSGFGICLTCHAFDKDLAGVESVTAENSALRVTGIKGAIEIKATETTDVKVVDMKGLIIDSRTVEAGMTATVSLPAGVYIVNDHKIAVR